MIEKYLNDTLMKKSEADLERISKTNLMPAYFKRLQYKEDSIRAFKWFNTTKDSVYIKKYFRALNTPVKSIPNNIPFPKNYKIETLAILPIEKYFRKPATQLLS